MSLLSQFTGGAGITPVSLLAFDNSAEYIRSSAAHPGLSGAAVTAAAGTYQTVLDITGAGRLLYASAAAQASNPAGTTFALRITLDGMATELSATPGYLNAGDWAVIALATSLTGGVSSYRAPNSIGAPYQFSKSLKIEVKRSLTFTTNAIWRHEMEI